MFKPVPRNPKPPKLNKKAIELLTELCFKEDDVPKKADLIFVYSSAVYTKKIAKVITNLLKNEISKRVLVTGGITKHYDSHKFHKTESGLVLEKVDQSEFPEVNFIQERKSTNTLENVTESLRLIDLNKFKSILFISKSHAAGRCYLTLRKYVKGLVIFQKTYNTKYPEALKEITAENWHTFKFGRERVWGEFLRIKKYGSRGDIEFEEVRNVVSQIEEMLADNFTTN